MKYKDSDIILCFTGIGKTYYKELGSNGSFTIEFDIEKEGIEKLRQLQESHEYRYILLPLSQQLVEDLFTADMKAIIIAPWYYEREDWFKTWVKCGDDIEKLSARAKAWGELNNYLYDDPMPKNFILIHIDNGEWLGNLLAATAPKVEV